MKSTDVDDHIASWSEFSEEIKKRNRYFPKSTIDLENLRRIFDDQERPVRQGVTLYRARIADDGDRLSSADMGAPPPHRANAGRANPQGIAYLYLAFDIDTCVHEKRAENQSNVVIGQFEPLTDLRVVDLADVAPPDFFDEDFGSKVAAYRYLRALGRDLSKPVRATDRDTDYIPTQFICEFAKSENFDGVAYSSAMRNGGRNLVLFDAKAALCRQQLRYIHVASITANWNEIGI